MQNKTNTISGILKPTPCSFVWKSLSLTNSYFSSKNSYDLSLDMSLEKALAQLSKDEPFMIHLKITEIALLNLSTSNFIQDKYFKNLRYENLNLISKIFSFSKNLPKDFKDWSLNKKLSPKDFKIFINDYSKNSDSKVFSKISKLNPTKSSGLQIIEYYFDLKASGKITSSFVNDFKDPEKLLLSLKKHRFSHTFNKDMAISKKLSTIDLSKGVKIRLKRIGDERSLKLEIQSTSLKQLITCLHKTSEKLKTL